MATIKRRIDVDQELTEAQINMLEKAKKSFCVTDEENPPLTKEELKQFHRVSEMIKKEHIQSRKQNVTLRLSPVTIQRAKSLGKGYTSILARIIEKALENPAITEMLIR